LPRVELRYFADDEGSAPVVQWLGRLHREDRRAFSRCHTALQRLAEFGHELRRPHSDYVQAGLHELRIRSGRTQYRILYSFHGRQSVVLIHAFSKEGRIPPFDLARALARKQAFEEDPDGRSHEAQEGSWTSD
jgi:phage-related protein